MHDRLRMFQALQCFWINLCKLSRSVESKKRVLEDVVMV
ncbi:hypothetical protein K2D_20180 [Planctomycetes bacterium K2D]|nr:hypothetical protein K2D_20180 [Planctomycetes bacterium K2D]